jgi:hypothetical protein
MRRRPFAAQLAQSLAAIAHLPVAAGNNKGRALFLAALKLKQYPDNEQALAPLIAATFDWQGWTEARARRTVQNALSLKQVARAQPCAPPSPVYADVWRTSSVVMADPLCCGGVENMNLLPNAAEAIECIDSLHLARALVAGTTELPRCCFIGHKPWPSAGYGLILPLYSPSGEINGLRARYLGSKKPTRPKAIAPKGSQLAGALMANGQALRWLHGEVRPAEVDIVEGETDYLAHAIRHPDRCILGVVCGSWSEDWVRVFPGRCKVNILTDLDVTGEAYALRIQRSLAPQGIICRRLVDPHGS